MHSRIQTVFTHLIPLKNKLKIGRNILFFLSFICIIFLSSCTALLQTQTSVQKATGQLPPRAYVIDYPANKNRIKPTLIPAGKMLTTNPNPFGVRYKDYIFKDYNIATETYKKNAPTYN